MPAAPTPQPVWATLARIPGLDLEQALAALNGNAAKLVQLLERFAQEYGDAAERLDRLLASAEPEAAARLVHTLRGTAGLLGLRGISAAAHGIEAQLRGGSTDGLPDALQALRQALQACCQGLQGLAGPAGLNEQPAASQ